MRAPAPPRCGASASAPVDLIAMSTPLELRDVDTFTFDCYGTLVDWNRSVASALGALLAAHGRDAGERAVLAGFSRCESAAREGDYRSYREVLRDALARFAAEHGFTPEGRERDALLAAVARAEPFPDTAQALQALSARYRICIISNTDDDLIAETLRPLDVRFDAVVTAQQARCYKPAEGIFRLALERVGRTPAQVVHAGQWVAGDVVPAAKLGMQTVWVRRSGLRQEESSPAHLDVPDLGSLTEALGLKG